MPAELPPRHKLEAFKSETIDRRLIKGAPYNPRYITKQAKQKLRRALRKVGLISPVTWNRRTGTLVSGHQRIAALDAVHGSDEYSLTVAVVDMSEAEERAANLLLNNPEAQGEWDMDKLASMLKDANLDMESAGMGSADIFKIVGEDAPDPVLKDVAERIEKMREIEGATHEKADVDYSTDYYLVVVFKDAKTRALATEELGLDDDRYVSGEEMMVSLRQRAESSAGASR